MFCPLLADFLSKAGSSVGLYQLEKAVITSCKCLRQRLDARPIRHRGDASGNLGFNPPPTGGQLVDKMVATLVDKNLKRPAKTDDQEKRKRLKGQHG